MRRAQGRAAVIGVVVVSVCGLAAGLQAAVATGGGAPLKECPAVHGVKWADPASPLTGNAYTVQASAAFGCTKADKLVPGLAAETVKSLKTGGLVSPKPPAGLVCIVTADKSKRSYIGRCAKDFSSPFLFTWGPGRG
jgi:hypothetical protein